MNSHEILALLREEHRNLQWPGENLERLPFVTRRTSDRNEVLAFALDESNVDEQIAAQVNYFSALGQNFEWKVFSFDTPSNLLQRLELARFHVDPVEKVVVFPLDAGVATLLSERKCKVVRVSGDEHLRDFRKVAESVFKKDYSFTTNQLAQAIADNSNGHEGYIAYLDGQPVSIGRLYTHPESSFAGLYGGGTLEEFRGRGCYRAVVAARAKAAHEKGIRYALVDALPTSLPILLKLGFTAITETWACSFGQDSSQAEVKPISGAVE